MSVNRRSILKGMALGSLAGPFMGGSLQALAGGADAPAHSATRPSLALISSWDAGAAFVQGARAAVVSPLQVHQAGPELGYLLDFERQLRRGQPMHVIGLLDDGAAVLVLDLARSAGARVHWLGQHTAEAGLSRHRLLNTGAAEDGIRQLSRQLHACGAGFTLIEECRHGTASARQSASPPRSDERSNQWAASIGYLLGSPGTGRLIMAPLVPASRTPLIGSFVSFSIEV